MDLQEICIRLYEHVTLSFPKQILPHNPVKRTSSSEAESIVCTRSAKKKDILKLELRREALLFFRETHLLEGEK